MASNDVELSEEQQLNSAASPNPVFCQPDMSSAHVRDDPRADDTPSEESSQGACECPPTVRPRRRQFSTSMAGGPRALASRVQVNEDSEELGQRDIARRRPTRQDMIIGLSASGRTPYVVAAIAYARARGAKTACITCNHGTPLAGAADIAIVADVGPEVGWNLQELSTTCCLQLHRCCRRRPR